MLWLGFQSINQDFTDHYCPAINQNVSKHKIGSRFDDLVHHGYHATVCMPGCEPNHG